MILAVWLSERKQKKLAESVESQRLDSSKTPDDMNKVEQTIDSEKHPLE
jgi:hypothetical protein